MKEMRNAYKILARKAEEKRLLRRPTYKWDFRETEWKGVN
jgi:hypothetical protein